MQKDKDELKPNKSKKTLTGQPASEIDPHPTLDMVANVNKGKTSDTKFLKKNADKGMQNEMVELILNSARRRLMDQRIAEEVNICETADAGLAAKSKKSGISVGTLRKVYRRGVAAWNSGHRPGTTPQQWGMARVNSYITKGKGTYGGADKDLHERDSRLDSKAYHAGVSPDTAKDRVTHWKNMDKLSDRDPRAYKPAPGDKDPEAIKRAQTTPGAGTDAYRRMYGEGMDEEVYEACWSNYKQVGVKKKGNRSVPNCVPKESFIDLSEVAGAGPIEMDQLVRMFMAKKNNEDIGRGMDDASYTKVFSDAMQHYVRLLQDAKNKGKPLEQVAKMATASFPEITPYGLFTGLKEILGIGDSAVKNRIVDEAMQKMTARDRFKAGLKRKGYNVDARAAEAERYHKELMKKNAEVMAKYAVDKNKVDEEFRLNEARRKSARSLGFLHPNVSHGVTASSEPYGNSDKHLPVVTTSSGKRVDIGHNPYPTPELAHQGAQAFIDGTYTSGQDPIRGFQALSRHHQAHGLQKEARELVAMPYATGFISDSIVKLGDNKYRLVSKKSGRNLGTYPSRAGAEKRERQVQYFKHANEGRIITPRPTKLTDKGVSDTPRPVQYTPKPATNNARNVSVLTPRPGSNNEEALGKIQRTSGGPKKFMVKVKDPSTGNVKTVRFGDPNMKIKRASPARLKSFRARHQCDTNPGPRTKARYWSCRQWRSGSKVEG